MQASFSFIEFRSLKFKLFLATMLVTLTLILASSGLIAAKAPGCHYDYYDSSCILVGHISLDCEGNIVSQWGIVTEHVLGGCGGCEAF